MNNDNNITDTLQTAATTAVAAVSKTPFRTAFSITMGIAAAHLLVGFLVLGGCAVAIGAVGYAIKQTLTTEQK